MIRSFVSSRVFLGAIILISALSSTSFAVTGKSGDPSGNVPTPPSPTQQAIREGVGKAGQPSVDDEKGPDNRTPEQKAKDEKECNDAFMATRNRCVGDKNGQDQGKTKEYVNGKLDGELKNNCHHDALDDSLKSNGLKSIGEGGLKAILADKENSQGNSDIVNRFKLTCSDSRDKCRSVCKDEYAELARKTKGKRCANLSQRLEKLKEYQNRSCNNGIRYHEDEANDVDEAERARRQRDDDNAAMVTANTDTGEGSSAQAAAAYYQGLNSASDAPSPVSTAGALDDQSGMVPNSERDITGLEDRPIATRGLTDDFVGPRQELASAPSPPQPNLFNSPASAPVAAPVAAPAAGPVMGSPSVGPSSANAAPAAADSNSPGSGSPNVSSSQPSTAQASQASPTDSSKTTPTTTSQTTTLGGGSPTMGAPGGTEGAAGGTAAGTLYGATPKEETKKEIEDPQQALLNMPNAEHPGEPGVAMAAGAAGDFGVNGKGVGLAQVGPSSATPSRMPASSSSSFSGGGGGGSGGHSSSKAWWKTGMLGSFLGYGKGSDDGESARGANVAGQVDLRKFMPGQNANSAEVASARAAQGIHGPNTFIWSALKDRYKALESTLPPEQEPGP